jgi:aerobic carbon-monoxide dehydrogenase medium subunit
VKPPRFKYAAPERVGEVVALLREFGDEAAVLAGGQSLVPLMNLRLARPAVLVDINRVSSLDGISMNGSLTISALTRQLTVERSVDVARSAPLIVEALRYVGHVATRTRGTFGGSVAHADPAAELPAVCLALDARVHLVGPEGERTVAVDDFFVSAFTTTRRPDELLTEVALPAVETGHTGAFVELARRHGDFALVSVAVAGTIDDHGVCQGMRIALASVASTPVRARTAEDFVAGQPLADQKVLDEAQRRTVAELAPTGDIHASSEYRREVAGVLVGRALAEAGRRGTES